MTLARSHIAGPRFWSSATPVVPVVGWFVSTGGSSSNDGSIGSPWDLDTAFGKGATLAGTKLTAVPNGDGGTVNATIVWVRAGTYGSGGTLKSPTLQGTSTNPVILRAYPGERVTWDLCLNTTSAPDLWFWNIEQTNTNSNTANEVLGWNLLAARNRVIHCQAWNNIGSGFGIWEACPNGRIYGSLSYINGRYNHPQFGHGLYLQNDGAIGTKNIKHSAFCYNLGHNIHPFGVAGKVANITMKQCLVLYNGVLGSGGNGAAWRGESMEVGETVIDGLMVYSITGSGDPADFGILGKFGSVEVATTFRFNNAYMRVTAVTYRNWQTVEFTGNTVAGISDLIALHFCLQEVDTGFPPHTWNNNAYFRKTTVVRPYVLADASGNQEFTFAQWKAASGYDAASPETATTTGDPTTNKIFVFVSDYEPKDHSFGTQGFITVFNWENLSSVNVDVSSVLTVGQSYKVYHVFDRYATTPEATGTYSGGTINIPMNAKAPPTPSTGWPSGAPPTPGPKFGAFVIVRTA